MKGLLQLRNTPDPDTGLSPAEMLLGISFQPSLNLTSPALRTSRKCGSLWLMVESWHWPQDQQSSTTGSASRPRSCRLLNLVTVYSFKTCWTTIQNDGISVESCSKLTQNTGSTRWWLHIRTELCETSFQILPRTPTPYYVYYLYPVHYIIQVGGVVL